MKPAMRNGLLAAALVVAALACDETYTVENRAPSASVTGWCIDDVGNVLFEVEVADPEADAVDVALVVRAGDPVRVLPGPAGDGTSALAADPDGATHFVHWANPDSLDTADARRACSTDGFEALPACGPRPGRLPDGPTVEAHVRLSDEQASRYPDGRATTSDPLPPPAPCPTAADATARPDASQLDASAADQGAAGETRDAALPDAAADGPDLAMADARALDAAADAAVDPDGPSSDGAPPDASGQDVGAPDADTPDASAMDAAAPDAVVDALAADAADAAGDGPADSVPPNG